MPKYAVVFIVSVLFIGCAVSKEIYTPDGDRGYSINCSGSAMTWGHCYEKAGKLCGSQGYNILEKTGDKGMTGSITQFGAFGGSVITRSMIVSCKK